MVQQLVFMDVGSFLFFTDNMRVYLQASEHYLCSIFCNFPPELLHFSLSLGLFVQIARSSKNQRFTKLLQPMLHMGTFTYDVSSTRGAFQMLTVAEMTT